MNIFKKIAIIASTFSLICFNVSNKIDSYNTELKIRDIDFNYNQDSEIRSYELLNNFDSYISSFDEDSLNFEGDFLKPKSYYSNYQNLSTINEEDIKTTYITSFNVESETLYLTTKYYQDDILINEETISTIPYFDESKNDYFIKVDDNNSLSVKESMSANKIDECILNAIAITSIATASTIPGVGWAAAGVLSAAFVVTIVATRPEVKKVVKTVVNKVITWVKTFWNWFTSLFVKKEETITTTYIEEVITPTAKVNNRTYSTELANDAAIEKRKQKNSYYLAIADKDGKMYLSTCSISKEVALTLMYTNITLAVSTLAAKKSKIELYNDYVSVSVYTFTRELAWDIVKILPSIETPSITSPHLPHYKGNGYFYHFHPQVSHYNFDSNWQLTVDDLSTNEFNKRYEIYKHCRPHSFFGYPS